MLCWFIEQIYCIKIIIWNFWIVWKYLSSQNYTSNWPQSRVIAECWSHEDSLYVIQHDFGKWFILLRRMDIRIAQYLTSVKQRKIPCQIVVFCYISLVLWGSTEATSCWKVCNWYLFLHLIMIVELFFPYWLRCLVFISTVLHTSPIKYIWSA